MWPCQRRSVTQKYVVLGETFAPGPSLLANEVAEVTMSTASGVVSPPRRSFVTLPVSVWVPLLAMIWVFVNVLLVRLGFRTGYQATCGLLAGGIDGSILASIILATLGDKLQAGTTGLLGGYGFHDALSKFESTKQYLIWIHDHSEKVLLRLLGQDEDFHRAVQAEVLWMACTAAIVMLLTLLVQLIRTARDRPAESR